MIKSLVKRWDNKTQNTIYISSSGSSPSTDYSFLVNIVSKNCLKTKENIEIAKKTSKVKKWLDLKSEEAH